MVDQADAVVPACQRDIRSRRSPSSPEFGKGAVCNHRDDGDEGVCGAAEHQCRLGGSLRWRVEVWPRCWHSPGRSPRVEAETSSAATSGPTSQPTSSTAASTALSRQQCDGTSTARRPRRDAISPRRVQPDGNTARLSAAFRRPSTMGARKHAAYRSPGTSSRFTQSRSEHSG